MPTLLALSAALATALPAAGDTPARGLLLELTQQTRLAGTLGSLVSARNVARHLESAGFRVEFDDREVLLSIPRRIEFEVFDVVGDARSIHQRFERFDPDAIPPGDLPLCNAWAKSGEVRARVVDAGRGLRADFERLKRAGVDVRGTIALVRYGGSYRGIKVDLATQYGCAGVLLFHERRTGGEEWPSGPWKPGYEGERGSISPMGRTPGDPSTPGFASPHPGEPVERTSAETLAVALPTIPCFPIGWAEAQLLLDRLATVGVTNADGKLESKPIGPGPAEVRMLLDQPRDVRRIRSVIATLDGASEDCVIAGNHRDAWVRGANDAGSGTVSLMRAAQLLGERVENGWKPKHTIKLCFFDAEEFGLIGSTEWGEANAAWIRAHVFAYVNADTAVNGTHFRGVDGTPGLLATLRTALERVATPTPRAKGDPANLWEDWHASLAGKEPEIGLAGSGSDFAVFLHHLSVPTLDIGFSGNRSGQYHTGFDDFPIVDRYIDPGFVGHELCARFFEELLVEFTDRGRASFDVGEAATALARVARGAGTLKDEGAERAWLGPERAERIAVAFEALARGARDGTVDLPLRLYGALALPVPGREWYCNPLWTPGLEDGYGSELFPVLHRRAGESDAALDDAVRDLVATVEGLATGRAGSPAKAPR